MQKCILSCGFLFVSLLCFLWDFILLFAGWFENACLDFVLEIVKLRDGSTEPVKNESYKEG